MKITTGIIVLLAAAAFLESDHVGASAGRQTTTRPTASLRYGSLHLTDFETWIVDFSYLNMIVQWQGEEICDVVLGADILISKSAVIDYKCRKLYLKDA